MRYARGTRGYLAGLTPQTRPEPHRCLRALEEDPRAPGQDIKLLRKDGRYRFFRLRLRDYRIVYSRVGDVTYVWRIFHRSEGYDWLDTFDPWDDERAPR